MPVSLMHEASVLYTYECSVMQSLLELPYQSFAEEKRKRALFAHSMMCFHVQYIIFFFI